ncbi:MAG: hypothetical protein AB8B78_09470 [Polaribacter sp.]
MFRFKFNEDSDVLQNKPLPLSSYLIYKQKRYTRRDKFKGLDKNILEDSVKYNFLQKINSNSLQKTNKYQLRAEDLVNLQKSNLKKININHLSEFFQYNLKNTNNVDLTTSFLKELGFAKMIGDLPNSYFSHLKLLLKNVYGMANSTEKYIPIIFKNLKFNPNESLSTNFFLSRSNFLKYILNVSASLESATTKPTETESQRDPNKFNPYLIGNQLVVDNLEDVLLDYKSVKHTKNVSEEASNTFNRRLLRTKRTLVLPAHVNITVITNSYDVIHS